MKYIIIGLGNYGHVLAEELSALGHEVIGADVSVGRVDSLKEKIATAFVIDATDEQALSVLPLNSVDVVIVAIGENFGAWPYWKRIIRPLPFSFLDRNKFYFSHYSTLHETLPLLRVKECFLVSAH